MFSSGCSAPPDQPAGRCPGIREWRRPALGLTDAEVDDDGVSGVAVGVGERSGDDLARRHPLVGRQRVGVQAGRQPLGPAPGEVEPAGGDVGDHSVEAAAVAQGEAEDSRRRGCVVLVLLRGRGELQHPPAFVVGQAQRPARFELAHQRQLGQPRPGVGVGLEERQHAVLDQVEQERQIPRVLDQPDVVIQVVGVVARQISHEALPAVGLAFRGGAAVAIMAPCVAHVDVHEEAGAVALLLQRQGHGSVIAPRGDIGRGRLFRGAQDAGKEASAGPWDRGAWKGSGCWGADRALAPRELGPCVAGRAQDVVDTGGDQLQGLPPLVLQLGVDRTAAVGGVGVARQIRGKQRHLVPVDREVDPRVLVHRSPPGRRRWRSSCVPTVAEAADSAHRVRGVEGGSTWIAQ